LSAREVRLPDAIEASVTVWWPKPGQVGQIRGVLQKLPEQMRIVQRSQADDAYPQFAEFAQSRGG
jgi:hypothetical protein